MIDLNNTHLETDSQKLLNKKRKANNKAPLTNYLNIWDNSPSFKDINSALVTIKTIFMIAILMLFSISSYLLTANFSISIAISLIMLCGFVIAFHEEFFSLRYIFSFYFHRFMTVDPFKDLRFWRLKEDPTSLFYSNSKDLINTGMRIFKVNIIAENVHPVLNQFVKALNTTQIPYSYQIIQNPLVGSLRRHQKLNSVNSLETSIYFSVFYSIKGILNYAKVMQIEEKLNYFSNTMKNNFYANFNHFKIDLLEKNDLINALRTLILRNSTIPHKQEHQAESKKAVSPESFFKYAFIFLSWRILLFFSSN